MWGTRLEPVRSMNWLRRAESDARRLPRTLVSAYGRTYETHALKETIGGPRNEARRRRRRQRLAAGARVCY
jgi:hypothetical protein